MKIYLSTWISDRSLGTSLTKKRASKRLLSYHFLREQKISSELLIKYCRIGRVDPRKIKK